MTRVLEKEGKEKALKQISIVFDGTIYGYRSHFGKKRGELEERWAVLDPPYSAEREETEAVGR